MHYEFFFFKIYDSESLFEAIIVIKFSDLKKKRITYT